MAVQRGLVPGEPVSIPAQKHVFPKYVTTKLLLQHLPFPSHTSLAVVGSDTGVPEEPVIPGLSAPNGKLGSKACHGGAQGQEHGHEFEQG